MSESQNVNTEQETKDCLDYCETEIQSFLIGDKDLNEESLEPKDVKKYKETHLYEVGEEKYVTDGL